MHSDEVLAFLEADPAFLQAHAARFGLRPAAERVVVPLAERQLLELRDKTRQLEGRLAQLLAHGEANDRTLGRLHRLTLALLAEDEPSALVEALTSTFADAFGLDRVALRLWHPAAAALPALCCTREATRQHARNLSAPYCGPYASDEVIGWFPAQPVLESFAQLPLRAPGREPFGLLVLASGDADRFTRAMHTQYLAQIGEMVSAALLRVLERDAR
ncbi:hypothetical protein EV683_11419 [Crenobacter luteus]|uniref:DUF484 family protein n=1 Tax=Crenobacter luteus TaxID=1452487 RepID=UPI00104A35B2|nr:DUF484 family protein [Crenobacter luteus]TCP11203.1 hypothetical protein EV683_11419 [Crenobacter luteus]